MLGGYQIGSRYLGSGRSVRSVPIPISGSATATATSSLGDLQKSRPLSGAAQASASSTGDIRVRIGLGGQATADATSQGSMAARRPLSGSATASAASSCNMGARKPLSGSSVARASSSYTGARARPIVGSTTAKAISQASLTRRQPISGTASATAESTLSLINAVPISGSATAVATSDGQFNLPFSGAEDSGRIIYVEPKDPYLIVEPKQPIIKVVEDDQGIVMEIREKQPSEIVDYVFDMRDWFKRVDPNDYIVSGVVTVEDFGDADDVVVGPDAKPDFSPIGAEPKMARTWIGAGVDGSQYKLTGKVTTNEGRVEEIDVLVIVREG